MHVPRILPIFMLGLAAQTAAAFAGWNVAMVVPEVRYAPDGQTWRPVRTGMELPGSAWIHTGPTGRLLLERSGELVQFKPNTVAAVTSGEGESTTVIVKFGASILDTPRGRRMQVATPHLGAMVKGTQFEVEVTLRLARLRVGRGLVEVTHLQRGERVDVGPEQQVTVLARGSAPFRFEGYGRQVRITRVPPAEAVVRPARPAPTRRTGGLTMHEGGEPRDFETPDRRQRTVAERLFEREARDQDDGAGREDAPSPHQGAPSPPEDAPSPPEEEESPLGDEPEDLGGEEGGAGETPGDADDGGSPTESPATGPSPA